MLNTQSLISRSDYRRATPVILLIALIHGLLYVMLVPPWQHYDEPTHFEYAYILAGRPIRNFSLPQEGETDPVARQQIAASMIEHGFYDETSRPNLLSRDTVNIGVMQINDQPLYYLFASLPLRLLRYTDVTTQLMMARLMSLLLYLFTIYIAAKATAELVPAGHPLRVLVPLVLALLPSFTDIMTAVNDDVGAVLVMTLFFWAAIRLLKYGVSAGRMAAALLITLACVYTKSTAMIAVPLLAIVLALGGLRRRQGWVWLALALALPLGLAATVTFGDAQYWYRGQGQQLPTSTAGGAAAQFPVGARAFQLRVDASAPAWGVGIRQPIPPALVNQLRGKRVTLGAWMWATAGLPEGTAARTPIFYDQNIGLNEHDLVYISTQPTFYAYSLTVPTNLSFASVVLAPFRSAATEATVYFDGVVLVEGDFPSGSVPQFADADAGSGTWAGKPFVNLLRNPSAESRWPMLRPSIDRLATRLIGTQASTTLSSLLDLSSTGWYYRTAFDNMLRSFWAAFGWGHVTLSSAVGAILYPFLTLLWCVGLVGCFGLIFEQMRRGQWRFGSLQSGLILLFGLACLVVWAIAFQRGLEFGLFYWLFVPSARYTFTVILPVVLMLTCGWLTLARWAAARFRLNIVAVQNVVVVGITVLFIGLDLLSLTRIVAFYTGR